MSESGLPTSLIEAIRYFSDQDVCVQFVAQLRWPDGPVCPSCGGTEHSYLKTRRVWKCKACKRQFSVKVGTIFEDSAIPLNKWLAAMWLIANSKNGISSHELARSLGITQKSGWFLLHRIRLAMQTGTFQKLDGEIEVDETFIGGKARNMHKNVRARKITGTGGKDKAIVAGVLQRGGEMRAVVVPDTRRATLQAGVREHVETGSAVYSDALSSYSGLDNEYAHKVVDHAEKYVDGQVHVNGVENFWSLLKRGLHGTYVSVQPWHLFPLHRRAGVHLQRARAHRLGPLPRGARHGSWTPADLQGADRQGVAGFALLDSPLVVTMEQAVMLSLITTGNRPVRGATAAR